MSGFAWRLGLRSIPQHKRRNLATAAAISFGYIALLLIAGYHVRVNQYMTVSAIFFQHSGHIAVFKEDGLRKRFVRPKTYSLTAEEQEKVLAYFQKVPEYDFAVPYLLSNGLVGNGCTSFPFVGRGFDPVNEAKVRNHPLARKIVVDDKDVLAGQAIWANPALENQVSLGRGLAAKLGKAKTFEMQAASTSGTPDCKDPLSKKQQEADRNLQFVGLSFDRRLAAADADMTSIFSAGVSVMENLAVQAPLKFIQTLLDTDRISYLAVFLKPAEIEKENLAALVKKANNDLKAAGIKVDAYAWYDGKLNPDYRDGLAVLLVTVGFIAAIVLFVVLLSIINTLSIGLAESRLDIGTLRSIGYNAREIAKIYVVESMVITLVALAVGSFLAFIITEFISSLNLPFQLPGLSNATTFQLTPTPVYYVTAAVGVALLVLLVTYFTARRYAKQDVLNLLDPGE